MPRDPYSPENIEATAAREAQRRAAAGSQSKPKAAAEFIKGMHETKMMEMGERNDHQKAKDYAPDNISPHGDLGILDDKEQRAFFPRPIKGANAEWQSSKHIPVGNKVRTMGDTERGPARMDGNSPVYPQHDLKDYSGIKAGSRKGGTNKYRGVTAKDHGMTNDRGERNPSYGVGGNYVG